MKALPSLLVSCSAYFLLGSASSLASYPSLTIPINEFFNNQAASINGSSGDFDGYSSSYDAAYLPVGSWDYDGIMYQLPETWGHTNDNIVSQSQNVHLVQPTYVHEMQVLYAVDGSGDAIDSPKTFELAFADMSTEQLQLSAKSWQRFPIINVGAIQTPYSYLNQTSTKNFNTSDIYQWSTAVTSRSPLTSINLPADAPLGNRLHIFAISITPSSNPSQTSGPGLSVRRARFSTRWETINGSIAQAVEVTLANLLPLSVFSAQNSITSAHTIELSGPGIQTVSPGIIYRLTPSDQVWTDVMVLNTGQDEGNATVTVKDGSGNVVGTSTGWPISSIPQNWTTDTTILSQHETPTWFNQAKFGIFVHWGVYSVPAWAPNGTYAEWYNWWLHAPPENSSNLFWEHHLETYGPSVVYDDFISNFTASKFNASEWLDIFDNAGAKYFVLVTKHHDGFALFDSMNTTHRSSAYMGPQKDLLAELFNTAKQEKPNMHRGTYYSMPEWFSPDYAKYGFGQWPGGLAHDAFNLSELEPYTGRLNISDYLVDLQLPHMLSLAETYETEIMWCDIGGPNMTPEFAARFYNNAMAKGIQVTMNNRCGAVPDYDTPEYQLLASIQTRKWETNEGMDPFSYGLNTATNASDYKNATTIIQTLVDVVSKNGNYLLDVGPTAEGEIIAPMVDNLLAAGQWLNQSGDCVYATDYWFRGAQEALNSSLRFLTTPTTFCVVSFGPPQNNQLAVNAQLPILSTDEIVYLGAVDGTQPVVPWQVGPSGIMLDTSGISLDTLGGAEAWAFQVRYSMTA